MPQAPSTLSHSVKQSKLAVVPLPDPPRPKPKPRPKPPTRAVLQAAIRDRLRAYRADDCGSYTWPGWGGVL
jgi:hypothetical protein